MFVYIVLLSCDFCSTQFDTLALTSEAAPVSSKDFASRLEEAAHQAGWFRYKDGIRCDRCLADLAYKRELTRQDAS